MIRTEQLLTQLRGSAGVLQDLHSFRAGRLIEEPATAGVHEYEMPLQFQQTQHAHLFFFGQPAQSMFFHKIADIFLGKIKRWNDPKLVALNPGTTLTDKEIVVVHRSDGSGTTYIFTDYLSKVSPDWKSKVGTNTSVNWPVGMGAKGNEGVSGQVKQTPGAIGYVELIYANQNQFLL